MTYILPWVQVSGDLQHVDHPARSLQHLVSVRVGVDRGLGPLAALGEGALPGPKSGHLLKNVVVNPLDEVRVPHQLHHVLLETLLSETGDSLLGDLADPVRVATSMVCPC